MILRLALFLATLPILAQSDGPSQLFTVGVGVQGLGPAQVSGDYSISQRIAPDTYTTQITEFVRMKGGTVGTSARAGFCKSQFHWGAVTLGLCGDAGAAEGSTGSASGALSGRGFLHWRFGHSAFGLISTAETLKVAGTDGQQGKITLGISFGLYGDH